MLQSQIKARSVFLWGGLALFFISTASAAPNVETATLSSDNTIKISGADFGQGPNVALYDNFEQASYENDSIQFSPQIGEWFDARGNGPLASGDEGPDSRSLVARDSQDEISSRVIFGVEDADGVHGLKHFQEVYFSYTLRDVKDFPGPNGGRNNFSDVSSTKDAWMMFGNRGDNTSYSVDSLGEPAGHDLYIPGWTGSGFTIAGNNTSMRPRFGQSELRNNWAFGKWVTKMFHAKLDPEDPYGDAKGFFSFLNPNKYFVNKREGRFMTDQTEEGVPYPYWDRIKFYAWLRTGDAEVRRLLDEVYVAIGANANARVLLSNAPTLTKSTRVHHLGPTSWTNDSIKAVTPDLDSSKEYYIHVINSNNKTSNSQYVCGACPEPPTDFKID